MIALANTTIQHLIQSLSLMLIHSLWQGLLLALFTGALLSIYTKKSASYKYNLLLANFLLFIVICACTFLRYYFEVEVQSTLKAIRSMANLAEIGQISNFIKNTSAYFSNNASTIFYCWLIVFTYKVMQMIANVVFLSRARHFKTAKAPLYWQERLQVLTEKLKVSSPVTLLQTGFVNMPMVIGHFKPVILLPVGLLIGLPTSQIEAILMHELAHIRRYDYLINTIQTCVETVFFFNPSLLWLSRLLREERENCCDDLALSQVQNKKEYITALVSFKEYTLTRNYMIAFSGEKNLLYQRITRIIGNNTSTLKRNDRKFLFTAFLLVLAFLGLTRLNTHYQIAPHTIKQVNDLSKKIKDDRDVYARTTRTVQRPSAKAAKFHVGSTILTATGPNRSVPDVESQLGNAVIKSSKVVYPGNEPIYFSYKQVSDNESSIDHYEKSTQHYNKGTDYYSSKFDEQSDSNLDVQVLKEYQDVVKENKKLVKKNQELIEKNQEIFKKDQEVFKKDQEIFRKDQEQFKLNQKLIVQDHVNSQ
ncbi:MAG: M56 family metallopeptidase [Flavobacterium sp.]|nr:MAG: M56 family metallopeptidase [Flavobacterium sp.]